ncbi:MAG: hydrogenase maturation protease [Planctomycetes bacterium]|nr:hydrogenase maturation protease [Planctomycetota bacterium]
MSAPPTSPRPERVVVLGLGNPLLRDDGVGPELAARVHALLGGGCELRQEAVGGIELLEILGGFDSAVVIDAIRSEAGEPGELYRLDLTGSRVPVPGNAHAFGLLEAIELGRRLGLPMPARLRVYAVEVADPFTFGTAFTPAVAAALPELARRIARAVSALLRAGSRRQRRFAATLP